MMRPERRDPAAAGQTECTPAPGRLRTTAALVGLALSLACGGGTSPATASSPAPVAPLELPDLVLVVLDTTRPDFLAPYGAPAQATPFLDELARQSTRFTRAYSSSCWTLPAHATMFTGSLPATHGATQSRPRVEPSLPLLAEVLQDAGYATACFTANPWVGKRSGLDRGFGTYERIDSVKKAWVAGRVQDGRVDRSPSARGIARWVREQQASDTPFFLFVNLMRAHHPYIPSPTAARELLGLSSDELREAVRAFYPELPDGHARSLMNRHYAREEPLSPAEWERLAGLYRASIRTADDDLRRVVEVVDRRAGGRDTLILVVSDHGESLGEHGHFGHIMNLYETSVRVAFLARGSGFEPGATDDTPVHLADVHATLLAAAGLPRTPGSLGVDLARERPERVLAASLEPPTLQLEPFTEEILAAGALDAYRVATCTAIGRRYKLIARSDGREELYDLAADPTESTPLDPAAVDAGTLAALRAAVAEAWPPSREAEVDGELDEETLEALRALGYVK